jgi:glycosyltransferase involved in cell wall biosynthesis
LFVGPDEGPSFEGPTGLENRLQDRVAELELGARVVFTGAVPFDELPAYYSVADVLAFPSTTAKECMGLAIKQAMACRVPVVVARAGGACEAISDGITGICCEPNDPASLAEAISKVLISPEREAMGEAGYDRGLKFFTQERTMRDTLEVYQQVLNRGLTTNRQVNRTLQESDCIHSDPAELT